MKKIIPILVVGILILSGLGVGAVSDDDTTPPVTTISFDPPKPDGENGWYVYSVLVTLKAKDDMSGVNATYYRINEGDWNVYTKWIEVEEEGIYVIEFYSVDNAGNVEDVNSSEFKIDNKDPFIHVDGVKINRYKYKFTATCIETMSGMDSVEFYCDGELIFTDYEEPYEWVWKDSDGVDIIGMKTRGPGDHSFDFIAYDKAGNDVRFITEITPTRVIGFIFNPEFSQYKVTFFAVIVYIWNNGEIVKFENFTFCTIGSRGYIGKFFIHATFRYGWPPY